MISEKFRYQLRQEAQKWHDEGLISSDIYEQLTIRYQLAELDLATRDRFVVIVLGVGFILLGLGVITFVAANWQTWSRLVRVILLLSLFVGTSCGGFYLWRSPQTSQSRIGRGLLLLGALSLGANIGLMSQMFHQTGLVYQLYLVWGLAVWAMAFSLRLTPLGLMAIILLAIAYCSGVYRIAAWQSEDLSPILQQTSLVVAGLFIPLAYYCRSRWIFGLSGILIVFSLLINIGHYLSFADLADTSLLPSWLFILIPGLFWGYRDNLLFPNSDVNFDPISRKLAVLSLGILSYFLSFNVWQENFDSSPTGKFIDLAPQSWLIAPLILLLFAIWTWSQLGIRKTPNLSWRLDRNSTYIAISLVVIFSLVWLHQAVSPLGIVGVIIANLLLFFLAMVLIKQSVKEGQRFNFWLGIILVVLQIFSRMFEYDTGLILKAIALFVCGIAAIIAGLWFERNLTAVNSQNND